MDSRGHTHAVLDADERSIQDVVRDIVADIQNIVRSEIKLAKIELGETARGARSSAIALVGGGLIGIYAIGFVLLAAMFALEIVLPGWLAALIVGVVLAIGAAIGLSAGLKRLKTLRMPEKTIQTVKEDFQWTKEQAKS